MIYAILLALLSIMPRDGTLRESCDLIERNHFFDEYGRLVFEQAIFIDFRTECGKLYEEIRAWRLIKQEDQAPQRDWRNGGYVMQWMDSDRWREVRSKNFRETWTQYDPELAARDRFPKERRRELRVK